MAHPMSMTVAEWIASTCAAQGVRRAFGVPGGGSCLDLIDAFGRHGIDFVLCRTETGAVLAAAADAELRHGFGVALATQGPGAACAMNGLAHASLDRAPVLFISDGWTAQQRTLDTHQVFDQHAMSAPVVKVQSRLESDDVGAELQAVLRAMRAAPWGPAHIILTGENARRTVSAPVAPAVTTAPTVQHHGDALALLRAARRPVVVVGLEARDHGAPAAVQALVGRLQCPVLTTYKAKGIVSDDAKWTVGHLTGGAAESDTLAAADLVVFCGLDPVELIGKPWTYPAPVLDIALLRHPVHYVAPAAAAYGPLAAALEALLPGATRSDWSNAEIAALREAMQARLAYPAVAQGVTPQSVVQAALRLAGPLRPQITVDAGAHMFSAMAFWQAQQPAGALISNGLATMAYALPAGIASALHAPERATLVFTGDGGLMMCAGELAAAAQSGARLCVIVFNDGALSLIALKQRNRQMGDAGTRLPHADFASVARGFGLQAFTAHTQAEYEHALQQALAVQGPVLIDVRVDPGGYQAQAKALRG
jgi:acetolactate synthase-1/2/3 large subunit